MATRRLLVGISNLVLIQQRQSGLCARQHEVILAGRKPEQLDPVVHPRVGQQRLIVPRKIRRRVLPEPAGAEDAELAERVEIGQADVERLLPAHGQPRDGDVLTPLQRTIVRLRVGDDVGHEVAGKRIGARPGHRTDRRSAGRMSCGHDDDHRLRLAACKEVVEYEIRPARHLPCLIVVAGAMKQVQHGIPLPARGVPWGRVNVHATGNAERPGLVVDRRHVAVRHCLLGEEVGARAGYLEQAAHRRHVDARAIIVRICHGHAVNVEPVNVKVRRRLCGESPDAGVSLGEHLVGKGRGPLRAQGDLARLGRVQLKRHLAVSANHGRLERILHPGRPGGRLLRDCGLHQGYHQQCRQHNAGA